VPHPALGLSTAAMMAAILLAIYAPSRAFLMLYGVAVAGMLFVWSVILLSHIRFRKRVRIRTTYHQEKKWKISKPRLSLIRNDRRTNLKEYLWPGSVRDCERCESVVCRLGYDY
jgi:amino acid transporter